MEQDNVWKEILDIYFQDFLAFFFPAIHNEIAWQRGYEFLDKELEKLVPDSELGRRFADKLVKVYLLAGEEALLLIHIEVQGYADTNFEQRMYVYNYRIFDRYNLEVISLAVLTDTSKKYRPKFYRVKRWDFELSFRFPTIKLIDYRKRWAELEANPNPFAVVVMAHLKSQQAKKPQDKLDWKLKLVRMLYERGYSRQQVLELFRFIDWMIKLPEWLEQRFEDELDKIKGVETVPYVTSIERRALARAERQGAVSMALRQLTKRFGELALEVQEQIKALSIEQLEELGEALLDFKDTAELTAWLQSKAASSHK